MKKYIEYIPVALIALLFISETEIERHAINSCAQLGVLIVTILSFFLVLFWCRKKYIAFCIALVLWICMMYFKQKMLVR